MVVQSLNKVYMLAYHSRVKWVVSSDKIYSIFDYNKVSV